MVARGKRLLQQDELGYLNAYNMVRVPLAKRLFVKPKTVICAILSLKEERRAE